MQQHKVNFVPVYRDYVTRLNTTLEKFDWSKLDILASDLLDCWETGRQVFIAGNGGSAGNANHIVNDFVYPVSKQMGSGLRMHSLAANQAVMTCLANDEGYDSIFSYQLAVLSNPGDVLIVLSGSGNSENIISVLEEARRRDVTSYAFLGYSGGKARELADVPLHFDVDDMQIAEDTQLISFHMLCQVLYSLKSEFLEAGQ